MEELWCVCLAHGGLEKIEGKAMNLKFGTGKFDYVLINDDLQTAKDEAEKVIGDFLKA